MEKPEYTGWDIAQCRNRKCTWTKSIHSNCNNKATHWAKSPLSDRWIPICNRHRLSKSRAGNNIPYRGIFGSWEFVPIGEPHPHLSEDQLK